MFVPRAMTTISAVSLGLLFILCGNDLSGCLLNAGELQIDSALLTLIEHAELSAQEAGPLVRLHAKEGDLVEEGGPLAQIDDRESKLIRDRVASELKVARALAENDVKVRFARKSLEVAEAELQRALDAVAKFPKSVSQSELDRLKLVVDKSKLEIEQAELDQTQARLAAEIKQQELERANLVLQRRSVLAPFPAVVVMWKKQKGEWVEPSTPIVRVIRLNRLRAEAFVDSTLNSAELVGAKVQFKVASTGGKDSVHVGKLVFVSPEIDPVNKQIRVWAEIDNANLTLRPGQSGTLVIGSVEASRESK